MKVYVASSWRNERQPSVVAVLRKAGHDVYDFRHPHGEDSGFSWAEIYPGWPATTAEEFRRSLEDPRVAQGFELDMAALRDCDACLMVQPCGRSAALELGWAAGAGKATLVLLADVEPELMLKMAEHFCVSIEEVVETLETIERNS